MNTVYAGCGNSIVRSLRTSNLHGIIIAMESCTTRGENACLPLKTNFASSVYLKMSCTIAVGKIFAKGRKNAKNEFLNPTNWRMVLRMARKTQIRQFARRCGLLFKIRKARGLPLWHITSLVSLLLLVWSALWWKHFQQKEEPSAKSMNESSSRWKQLVL